MSLRPLLVLAVAALALGVNGYLIFQEHAEDERGQDKIADPEERARHIKEVQDPLQDIRFTVSERETNFGKFGFSEDQVQRLIKKTRQIDDRYGEKLQRLLLEPAEPRELSDSLCGLNRYVRPRYGALRFLVVQKNDQRQVLDLRRVQQLERQEWSIVAPIDAVYQELELNQDRLEDATRMGIAAVLASKESDAVERFEPWGSGRLPGSWSYEAALNENPGLQDKVVEYFALMHLVVEYATSEEGICGG